MTQKTTGWEEEEAEHRDDSHVTVRRLKSQVQDHISDGSVLDGGMDLELDSDTPRHENLE